MAEDEIKKKILIEVEAKTERLKQNAVDLNVTLDAMKAEMKDVEKQSGKNSVAYQELASRVRLAQQAIRDNNRELDNASKALKAQSNSIEQNRALVATLTAEHIRLTQAEGESSAAARSMEATLGSVLATLKEQTKAYGDHRLEVGNYGLAADKINEANKTASEGFKDLTKNLYSTGGGFGFLPQEIKEAGETIKGFYETQRSVVEGFRQHRQLVIDVQEANVRLTAAQEQLTVATEANVVAQEQLAAGTITQTEATAAATVMQEAHAEVTVAETAATEAATLATNANVTSLKLLKIALASTGIGALIVLLGTLYSYFEESNEGANKFKVILNQVSELFGEITERLAPIGSAIFKAFSGTDGVKFFASALMTVLIPLKTILTVLSDLKNGEFKKAFTDLGEGAKEWAKNEVEMVKSGIGLGKDLVKNVSEAAAAVKKDLTIQSFKDVAKEAGQIVRDRQALTKAERLWSEEKLQQQGILDVLKLKIRDTSLAEKDRIAAAQQAKKISDNIYNTELQHAETNLKLVQRQANMDGKKDYQAITDAKNRVQALKNAHDSEIQSIQNRQAKVEGSLAKEGKAWEELKKKIRAANDEADNVKMASVNRQLQATLDGFAGEILALDQHYKELLDKQRKDLGEGLINKAKFNEVKVQLESEHQTDIQKVIEKFGKENYASVLKSQNELAALFNQGLRLATEKDIETLKQATAEKIQQLKNESDQIQNEIISQEAAIKLFKTKNREDAAVIEQNNLNSNIEKLKLNVEKRVLIEKQTLEAIEKRRKEAAQQMISSRDAAAVASTSGEGQEKAHLAALQTQLTHEYELKIANERAIGNVTLGLEAEFQQKKAELNSQYNQKRVDEYRAVEQAAQQFAFDYLAQSLQAKSSARLSALEKDKAAELNNSSLTNAQKTLIEERYAKKEKQEKLKAFKAEQRLQIAQTVVNGLAAMVKTSANVGFPLSFAFQPVIAAQTAFAIAGILAQKPAFARGGYFKSDGHGSMVSGPGTGTSDSINARLSHGEAVINARSTAKHGALLSAINVDGGGRAFLPGVASAADRMSAFVGKAYVNAIPFAAGGVYRDPADVYMPYNDNGLRPGRIIAINNDLGPISAALTNLPGNITNAMSQVQIVTDVKDVSYQQGVINRVENRVNL